MKIWIDADACPKPIKEILYRAADRTRTELTLVANHSLQTPPSPYINTIQVPGGFDVADNRIAQDMQPGDLVITADIPLAARCLRNGATVIGPTGKPFDDDSIGMALATRDLLTDLRSAGATTRGPPPLSRQDLSRFLSALDLAVTRLQRKLAAQR